MTALMLPALSPSLLISYLSALSIKFQVRPIAPTFFPFTVWQPAPTALKLVGVVMSEEEQDALEPPLTPRHCQRKLVSLSTISENDPASQTFFVEPQTPLINFGVEHDASVPPFAPLHCHL